MTRNEIFDEIRPVVLCNAANVAKQKHNYLHRDHLLRLLQLVIALRSLCKHILHVLAAVGVVAIKEQPAV